MVDDKDDGTLRFLNIPNDTNSRSFNCDEITQSKLVDISFWIIDFIEDIPTKFSKINNQKGKTLVKIKMNLDSSEHEAKKFFTGSSDILYILRKIKEMNKFPRKVTLRRNANRFWIE